MYLTHFKGEKTTLKVKFTNRKPLVYTLVRMEGPMVHVTKRRLVQHGSPNIHLMLPILDGIAISIARVRSCLKK